MIQNSILDETQLIAKEKEWKSAFRKIGMTEDNIPVFAGIFYIRMTFGISIIDIAKYFIESKMQISWLHYLAEMIMWGNIPPARAVIELETSMKEIYGNDANDIITSLELIIYNTKDETKDD